MDDLWLRFPDLLGKILQELDNKSIVNCLCVNKTWEKCVKSEVIFWKRKEEAIARKGEIQEIEVSLKMAFFNYFYEDFVI